MSDLSKNSFTTISSYQLSTLNGSQLKLLWETVERFGIEQIRFTPGSQIKVSGLAENRLADFVNQLKPLLKPLPANGITSIYNCNEQGECKNGCITTAKVVEMLCSLDLPQPMPARIKAAVAGCPRCCTMPRLRDIGMIPASLQARTWHVYFGGHGGRNPRIADPIGEHLRLDESLALIRRALIIYQSEAKQKMRTSSYLRTTTLDSFLKKIEKIAPLDSGQGI
jgi:NAD(P)H-nitrite reductase large subunit